MELPHLGEHCSVTTCNVLDFLPFKCKHCKCVFCVDHFSIKEHQCVVKEEDLDRRAVACPVCQQVLPVQSTTSPTQLNSFVMDHIKKGCPPPPLKSPANTCSVPGCRKKELTPILCSKCFKNHCLKHRYAEAHACPSTIKRSSRKDGEKSENRKKTMNGENLSGNSVLSSSGNTSSSIEKVDESSPTPANTKKTPSALAAFKRAQGGDSAKSGGVVRPDGEVENMTEEEQIQLAIQQSMTDETSTQNSSNCVLS